MFSLTLSLSLFLCHYLFFPYTLINTYTSFYSYTYSFPTLYLVGGYKRKWTKDINTRKREKFNVTNLFSLTQVEKYE